MLQNIFKLYTLPCTALQGIAFLSLPEVTKNPEGSNLHIPLPHCLLDHREGAVHGWIPVAV